MWPESKQIGLIDSLFRNYYVPPIIFAVRLDEDGEEVRICVDGKQVCLYQIHNSDSVQIRRIATYIHSKVLRRPGECCFWMTFVASYLSSIRYHVCTSLPGKVAIIDLPMTRQGCCNEKTLVVYHFRIGQGHPFRSPREFQDGLR